MGLFCEQVLQQPELASDERFASNRQARRRPATALRAIIVEVFAALTAEQVVAAAGQPRRSPTRA